jgi:uncharacterized SAM-binding protein YcdF (DUF218 family)
VDTVLFLKGLLGNLLLPPTNGLLLLSLAALFHRRRVGFALALLGGGLLLAQSLPPVAGWLNETLEERAGPVLTDTRGAGAIVVLGSGLNLDAPEYSGDTVNERSLVRARYGAVVARRFGLPVLVSGGQPRNASRSEADVIADLLEKEFGVPVRWREGNSLDTADNARFSAVMLHDQGIRKIVLVTQAFHMPRARRLFEAAGFEVIPAPTELSTRREQPRNLLDWLPRTRALQDSYYALHEWLGLLWLDVLAGLKRLDWL